MGFKFDQKLENEIENIAKNEGFDIEYIEFVKEAVGNVFRIVLDKPNDIVDVEECEKISHLVEDIVDKYIKNEYILEVSSPGVERQLKNIKLYRKYIGKEIFVKMYKKQEYGKEFVAILNNVIDDNSIEVLIENTKYIIDLKDIASSHTTYDFAKKLKENSDNVNINELKKF